MSRLSTCTFVGGIITKEMLKDITNEKTEVGLMTFISMRGSTGESTKKQVLAASKLCQLLCRTGSHSFLYIDNKLSNLQITEFCQYRHHDYYTTLSASYGGAIQPKIYKHIC